MKKITILSLVLLTIAISHANSQTTDSIAPAPVAIVFPYLQPVSSYEEVNVDIMSLQFEKASTTTKKLTTTAKRKKEPTAELEKLTAICQKGENGLRGVDKVLIVDSLVISKKDFLKAYPLLTDIGTLSLSKKGDIVQYQTQINGMVLRPESISTAEGERLQMMRYYVENGQLTEDEPVEGLGIDGDINYPFLMPDGQTFYFAARSTEGYGNYDLYVTRYDSDSQRFYHAENMGYPYNSYANDYMMVIDEEANLGWFASDRYQPDSKVCIYTFIPNPSRHTIDYETTDINEVRTAASLHSLSALSYTDEQRQTIAEAKQRVRQLTTTAHATTYQEFEFVLNDAKTYYSLADFTSYEAKKLCSEWVQKSKNLTTLNEQLQQLRDVSPSATQQILNLEKRIMELQDNVHQLAKSIRATELSKQ